MRHIKNILPMIFGLFWVLSLSVSSTLTAQTTTEVTPYCHDDGTNRIDVSHVKIITIGRQGAASFFWMNPVTGAQITAPPAAELTRGYCDGATATDTAAVARLDRIIDSLAVMIVAENNELDSLSRIITLLTDSIQVYTNPINLVTNHYRVAGTATGTSTPSTDPSSTPTVGNTFTVTGPFEAFGCRWQRGTSQDPGDGSVAKVTINGFDYYPGTGGVYSSTFFSVGSEDNQTFSNSYQVTASNQAFCECISIIKQ